MEIKREVLENGGPEVAEKEISKNHENQEKNENPEIKTEPLDTVKSDISEKSDQSDPCRVCRKRRASIKSDDSVEISLERKRQKKLSDDENDELECAKSESSAELNKSISASTSTPDPASTPDEDRSDLGESNSRENVTLFWFTEAALRMYDNPGLRAAVKDSKAVRFCYFLDERFVRENSPKWKFIKSALNDIDDQLKKLGSRLHVLSGQPSEQLPKIFAEWHVIRLGFTAHPGCAEMRQRDRAIVSLALRHGVEVVYREGPHCLYPPKNVIKVAGGMPPLTFKRFVGLISHLPLPAVPIHIPESDIVMSSVSDDNDDCPSNELLLGKEKDTDFPWYGGETEARHRFEQCLIEWKSKKTPKPDLRNVTPYIIQGCLSIRQCYYEINRHYEEIHGKKPALSIHMAALHRDFLYCLGSVKISKSLTLEMPFKYNESLTGSWLNSKTGYPWVDAVNRQMRDEGWAPPLLRQSSIWFLTRGMLWQKPEVSISFLSEHCLLDLPLAIGFTNWAAGIGAWVDAPDVAHRCAAKSATASYMKRWLPPLTALTDRELEEPWTIENLPKGYPKCIVPHRQSHRQSEAKYIDSLKMGSNKLLTKLDQIKRNGKVTNPIALEPSPWELVQPNPTPFLTQMAGHVTGINSEINRQAMLQNSNKNSESWYRFSEDTLPLIMAQRR